MNLTLFQHTDIFIKLFKTRLLIAYHQLFDKIINIYIWSFCTLIVSGYVMQAFGLISGYGAIQLAGVLGTVGFFEIYGNTANTLMDFEGDRSIEYYLTLPTTPSVIIFSMASVYSFIGICLTILTIPLGKLLLWNTFSLSQISWLKFAIIIIVSNLFFGMSTLAIAAHTGSMNRISNVWMRFLFPLWFFGGFQFSWQALYNVLPWVAYCDLANPILYVMEGVRASVLGQEGYLPWWICVVMLCVFTGLSSIYAYRKMKKLLDFV
jgi:ABC-2 type transport system permease protein